MIVFYKQINQYDINAQYFFSDEQGYLSLQNIPYTKDLVLLQQNVYNSFFITRKS